jgi:hypothetical protein
VEQGTHTVRLVWCLVDTTPISLEPGQGANRMVNQLEGMPEADKG